MIVGSIDYGSWKDGSSIFKDNKGYYIAQFDINKGEYKKYLKNWKPSRNNEPLYLDRTKKKWFTFKQKTTKKINRSSPSYHANDFCGKNKKGNDGNMYISKKNKKGICRWLKINKLIDL